MSRSAPAGRGERVEALFSGELAPALADLAALRRRLAAIPRAPGLPGRSGGSGVRTAARLPEQASDPERYLDGLFERVIPGTVAVDAPRFIGHMTSALPRFFEPLSALMAALNQNLVKVETSGVLTELEREALAMLHRLVYERDDAFYERHAQAPESTLGIVTAGGSTANILGLWIARNGALGARDGFEGVEAEGLAAALLHHGYERAAVVGSSLMHYSFRKAAALLGLGERQLVGIPARADHRLDPEAARAALEAARADGACPIALVGIAGATETGSVDPLEELAEVAEQAGVAFHVDAAWGGPTLFSERHRGLLAGIERADSVTLDAHKQLYLPQGIGLLLLRDPRAARLVEKSAAYSIREGSADLGRRTLEGSRPAMALLLHAGLHVIGAEGYAHLVDEGLRKARRMAELVRERPGFELLAEPELNILAYRWVPPELRELNEVRRLEPKIAELLDEANARIQEAEARAGRSFVSRTLLAVRRGGIERTVVALRVVLANPLTADSDVVAVLDEQEALAGG